MSDFFKKSFFSLSIFLLSLVLPFSVFSASLQSTNFSVEEYTFGSGDQSNSTNFSITGSIDQVQRGLYSVSNLPLAPGNITSCGKITTAGTYTLTEDLIGISESCFYIEADNVTINGNGHTVLADVSNASYAIIATSSSSGSSAPATTTIQNITFSGFFGGVFTSGNTATSGNTNGGDGGTLIIENSTMGAIVANAGLGSGTGVIGRGGNVSVVDSSVGNISTTGTSGIISISKDDLDISNKIYTTSGTFSISYIDSLTTTNTTISSISNFIVNGINYGSYIGGAFPIIPGNITACGSLYFSGTYTLTGNSTSNCSILKTGITIEGDSYTLTGNISAGLYGGTLSNINVTGSVSTTGAGAGVLNIINSSNIFGNTSVTGQISGDGSSSLANTTIAVGGSVATSSVSFVSDVVNNGTIYANNSVAGKLTNNGSLYTGAGTFVYNASSTNSGTVYGNVILSASSTNTGTITGDAQFNQFIANSGIVSVTGSNSFSGTGYVSGDIFDQNSEEILSFIFEDTSTLVGILNLDAVFTDTSSNTISGTVIGNAEFRDTSTNLGTVTGDSHVYAPVVRPLGGTTNGSVIYHDYDGLYYNDSASGHGVVGMWDDILNWWVDVNATIHAPVIPTSGDTAIILSGTISTTTVPASVYSVIFKNSSINEITITVSSSARDAARFEDNSINNGTIIGNATFVGENSEHTGTVTGYITRQYSTGVFTILEDFTHNGIHWIIQAVNGATVNVVGATYSLITNTFEALQNSIFVWNSLIGIGAPDLVISSPVSGTNIKWDPDIEWDTNTLCQYKFDAGTYISVNCALGGSDIPKPSAGAHTFFVKSTDSNGNIAEKSIALTYDNTQPIDTDCSTPLDEVTRPYYYLTSNVGSCTITATTTLRGDDGLGNYYSASSITGSEHPLTLENITVSGLVSGFGNMIVSSSTISGSIIIEDEFEADTLSSIASSTITSSGVVTGGRFVSTVHNAGVINTSSTTPVTVSGSLINTGTINGDSTLNNSSINYGTINGNVLLNNNSVNRGIINGDLTFNTLTSASGIITFEDDTVFLGTGTTTGIIYDNQSNPISIWVFKDTSTNLNRTEGTVFFEDDSSNLGTVAGNAHFDDEATNSGIVTGNAYRYKAWLASKLLGGTVFGSKTYYSHANSISFRNISGDNNWSNTSNWFLYSATTTPLGRLPVISEDITLFASTTLKNNITNNIYISGDGITLNGGGYALTGNIFGNGPLIGNDAYDFNLLYITIYGTTSAMGADGYQTVSGGNGGNIDIRYSSTGPILVNGGDPEHDGGDGGTLYLLNSIGVEANTSILAAGGDAFVCGYGGDGGSVTLIDTAQYIIQTLEPGRDATSTVAQGGGCENPPSGRSGSRGVSNQTGVFNPSLNTPNNTGGENPTANRTDGSRSLNWIDRLIPIVKFNLPDISELDFRPLPIFGIGGDSFSFIDKIRNFFSGNVFKELENKFYGAPSLLSYLNIRNINDLIFIKNNPIRIEDTKQKGLFSVYSEHNTKPLGSFISSNSKGEIVQIVYVSAGDTIKIALIPTLQNSTYTAKFEGEEIEFSNNIIEMKAPSKAGTYILSSYATPIILHIEVIENQVAHNIENNFFFKIVIFLIKMVKTIFSCILLGC